MTAHRWSVKLFSTQARSVNYDNRIEFQLLQTQMHLQEDNLNYYKWSFIPSLSLYGGYTFNYQNSFVDPLFNQHYPIFIRWPPAVDSSV